MTLDVLIRAALSESGTPGCSVIVVRDGVTLHEAGYGLANVEHNVGASPDSVYEIASITKLFTATAVMQLVQDGTVSLDSPIADYLPNLPLAWHTVSVRHALAHQSGIKSYTAIDRYWATTRDDIGRNGILELIRDLPLSFDPGTRHAYDNSGYYLLGLLIEQVSGLSYGAFLKRHQFDVLGMDDTQVNTPEKVVGRRANGYSAENGQLRNKAYYATSGTFSAGVLLSTVRDLSKFVAAAYDDRLLNHANRTLMWTPQPSQQQNEREHNFSMCLGWYKVDMEDGTYFMGHNGSIVGFASTLVHFPHDRSTVIVLCNADQMVAPHELAFAIRRHVVDSL